MVADANDLDDAMARLSTGDRSAFDQVYRSLWPVVRKFCDNMLHHTQDAEDAAQLALEKIFSRAHQYDPCRACLPWALSIVGWECRTQISKRKRNRVHLGRAGEVAKDSTSPESALLTREFVHAATQVVEKLSLADQQTLRELLEPGGSMHLSSPTWRKRKQRALQRFKRIWGQQHDL